jgi:CoA binding domain
MESVTSPRLGSALEPMFNPSSVAIYGISDRTSTRIAQNMTVQGVPFYGINPTRDEACGIRCYPTIGDCPAVPELVVLGWTRSWRSAASGPSSRLAWATRLGSRRPQ